MRDLINATSELIKQALIVLLKPDDLKSDKEDKKGRQ
jgi:hypothetical protein